MADHIMIEATGTLHRVRDDEGASYRFVSDNGPLVSGVIFKQGKLVESGEVEKFRKVKFKLVMITEEENKEYSMSTS